jgi:hypothetical protein
MTLSSVAAAALKPAAAALCTSCAANASHVPVLDPYSTSSGVLCALLLLPLSAAAEGSLLVLLWVGVDGAAESDVLLVLLLFGTPMGLLIHAAAAAAAAGGAPGAG